MSDNDNREEATITIRLQHDGIQIDTEGTVNLDALMQAIACCAELASMLVEYDTAQVLTTLACYKHVKLSPDVPFLQMVAETYADVLVNETKQRANRRAN